MPPLPPPSGDPGGAPTELPAGRGLPLEHPGAPCQKPLHRGSRSAEVAALALALCWLFPALGFMILRRTSAPTR